MTSEFKAYPGKYGKETERGKRRKEREKEGAKKGKKERWKGGKKIKFPFPKITTKCKQSSELTSGRIAAYSAMFRFLSYLDTSLGAKPGKSTLITCCT